jgi:hypothetical protein
MHINIHETTLFGCDKQEGLFSSIRINRDGNGCFELPPGEWGTLKLTIKRVTKMEVKLTMEMNGKSFSVDHTVSTGGLEGV